LPSFPDIGIFSLASPNFDYDTTSSYEVMVDCTDSKDTVSKSLFVYLIKNAVPLVHNLPSKCMEKNHVFKMIAMGSLISVFQLVSFFSNVTLAML
jgi:hypothetical protein